MRAKNWIQENQVSQTKTPTKTTIIITNKRRKRKKWKRTSRRRIIDTSQEDQTQIELLSGSRKLSTTSELNIERRRGRTRKSIRGQQRRQVMLTTATILILTAIATCFGLITASATSVPATEFNAHDRTETPGNSDQRKAVQRLTRASRTGGELSATGSGEKPARVDSAGEGVTLGRPQTSIKNVTAQNGQSVVLHCLVEPSSEPGVSWFRGAGELQLLTYENNTIIPDDRFVVRRVFVKDDDWALQIRNLDKNDAGLYQCQTNSEPPLSQYYQLNIVEPQVNILGAPDLAVKLGAAINLTCVISQSPDQLQFVFWYRDERMINYDLAERGKIVMSKWPQKADTLTSNLLIYGSRLTDSGNYTCMPSGARPTSIHVHVLEGSFDKRLIMFQNDNYYDHLNDPSAASSSQQTNSAISLHMVRLSQGRVYAAFIAFTIFSAWFQLVAQAQTAISLSLLAIIGLLLGRTMGNEEEGTPSAYLATDDDEAAKAIEAKARSSSFANQQDPERRWRQPKRRQADNETSSPASSLASAPDQESARSLSATTMEPLISRANNALDLLQSLRVKSAGGATSRLGERGANASASGSQDEEDIEEDSNSIGSTLGELDKRTLPEEGRRAVAERSQRLKLSEKPLNSPSSSSTASTGYNSEDARSRQFLASPMRELSTPSHRLIVARVGIPGEQATAAQSSLADTSDEMIELVASKPTAMQLLMDQFSARSSTSPDTPTLSLSPAPLKPPRVELIPAGEPHYSAPIGRRWPSLSSSSSANCGGATCDPVERARGKLSDQQIN